MTKKKTTPNKRFSNPAGDKYILSFSKYLLQFQAMNNAEQSFFTIIVCTLFSNSYGLTIFKYRRIAKPLTLGPMFFYTLEYEIRQPTTYKPDPFNFYH